MHYQLTTLPNGLRVITETMPGIRSVSVGAWVDTGTRDEHSNEAGASHFLEHLLFKGSEQYSARQISEKFDAMGAEANAFTSKDHTCFWGRMLDTDLAEGVEMIGEMLQRPALRPREIESERQVVIEEINESEDDPSDLVFEQFTAAVFAGHPLERPVLGTREAIKAMTPQDIEGYWARRYGAHTTVVALAGSVEHDSAVKLVSDLFGGWDGRPGGHDHSEVTPGRRVVVLTRPTEQTHLVVGGKAFNRSDPRRWAFEVLNHVLGGGMSSRLFTTIREERGLVYSVYSFRMSFADAGTWGVYAATAPDNLEEVLGLIRDEIGKVVAEGISEEELERAKGAMRGGLALAMEDANSRMVRLGRDELVGAPHLSIDERIRKIDAVALDEVRTIATQVLTTPLVASAVGPLDTDDLERLL